METQIIEQALKRLYARIDNPTAKDQTFYRVATKALAKLSAPPEKGLLDGMSIAAVQQAVDSGALSAVDALEAERKGQQRKTLIAWLEIEVGE